MPVFKRYSSTIFINKRRYKPSGVTKRWKIFGMDFPPSHHSRVKLEYKI